jgi:hypothetical protein
VSIESETSDQRFREWKKDLELREVLFVEAEKQRAILEAPNELLAQLKRLDSPADPPKLSRWFEI